MAIITSIHTKTAATSNVITTAQAKTHLRIDAADADENTYIDSLIVTAQRQVESYTNLVFNATTFYFYLSDFPYKKIVLPYNPVSSITAITYYDGDNSLQTWDSSNYTYNKYDKPCQIVYVNDPPETYEYRNDAVIIEFVCSYTSPDVVPVGCVHAVKLLLTDMYENRIDQPREKFTAWQRLCYPHRVFHSTNENNESW